MKAGTHNRKYEYTPPEQRIGKKEQQRIKRRKLHKVMRKEFPKKSKDWFNNNNNNMRSLTNVANV